MTGHRGGDGGFRHLGDRLVHRGHVWDAVVGSFESPDGDRFDRDLVRSKGAVAALPLERDASGEWSVHLVRQYRPAYDEEVIEIPAGMRDVPGEPIETTIARELVEEVGLVAGSLRPLVRSYPQPGTSDAVQHIYVATDLTPVDRDLQGVEEAHSEVLRVSLAAAIAMVVGGEIHDSKTVIALLLVERDLRLAGSSPP